MSNEERVHKVINEHLGVTIANNEQHIEDDLGADSLDGVELTMAIEEEFDINITDEEFAEADTVQKVITLVDTKLEGRNG